MDLIDSHAHIDFPQFAEDRDAMLARARAAGVNTLLAIGVGPGPDFDFQNATVITNGAGAHFQVVTVAEPQLRRAGGKVDGGRVQLIQPDGGGVR